MDRLRPEYGAQRTRIELLEAVVVPPASVTRTVIR
jgi:hypothetical protein